jgi:hypothetical protein
MRMGRSTMTRTWMIFDVLMMDEGSLLVGRVFGYVYVIDGYGWYS